MHNLKSWCKKNKILIIIILIIILTRLLILSVGYLSELKINEAHGPPSRELEKNNKPLLESFMRYDAYQYLKIVKKGYFIDSEKLASINFFPLYPILIKTFNIFIGDIIGGPRNIGYIISNIALIIACLYFYKLIRLDYDKEISLDSVFYMLIYPASFYFSIVYTEGLFLALAISALYYARKKQWMITGILGFFLSLTRVPGVFIFIPVLMEYFDINYGSYKISFKKIKKDILYLALIPAGLISFMVYQYIKFKDPLAFYHAKSALNIKYSSFAKTITSLDMYPSFDRIVFFMFLIFALVLIIYLFFKNIRLSYLIYSIVLLSISLSQGKIEAIHRYIGVIFPIYIGLGMLSKKRMLIKYIITCIFITLLTFFVILWVRGYSFY